MTRREAGAWRGLPELASTDVSKQWRQRRRRVLAQHSPSPSSACHNQDYGCYPCRRRIKMSPLCRLEMTLPRGFLGGVRGDGLADERRGADAARSAAGSGSKTIDDRGGGAVVEARASSGVPAVEGVPDHGSGGPDR